MIPKDSEIALHKNNECVLQSRQIKHELVLFLFHTTHIKIIQLVVEQKICNKKRFIMFISMSLWIVMLAMSLWIVMPWYVHIAMSLWIMIPWYVHIAMSLWIVMPWYVHIAMSLWIVMLWYVHIAMSLWIMTSKWMNGHCDVTLIDLHWPDLISIQRTHTCISHKNRP